MYYTRPSVGNSWFVQLSDEQAHAERVETLLSKYCAANLEERVQNQSEAATLSHEKNAPSAPYVLEREAKTGSVS